MFGEYASDGSVKAVKCLWVILACKKIFFLKIKNAELNNMVLIVLLVFFIALEVFFLSF